MKNLAQNLKRFRTQNHLNQFEFTESGSVSEDTIGFVEQGQANPTLNILGDIAAYMGVPVDELLRGV